MSTPEDDAARALAEAVGHGMYARDRASQHLGMALDEIGPGFARMRMRVLEHMVNGHNLCHGGLIFCLADSAFAFACNSYNDVTVAAGGSIEFLRPAVLGELLIATACEQTRGKRTGIYDVRVQAEDGRLIALFRGRSSTVGGQIIPTMKA